MNLTTPTTRRAFLGSAAAAAACLVLPQRAFAAEGSNAVAEVAKRVQDCKAALA